MHAFSQQAFPECLLGAAAALCTGNNAKKETSAVQDCPSLESRTHLFWGGHSDSPKKTGHSKPGEAGSPPQGSGLGSRAPQFPATQGPCLSGLVAAGTQSWQAQEALCPWEVGARVLGVASVWSSLCPCRGSQARCCVQTSP